MPTTTDLAPGTRVRVHGEEMLIRSRAECECCLYEVSTADGAMTYITNDEEFEVIQTTEPASTTRPFANGDRVRIKADWTAAAEANRDAVYVITDARRTACDARQEGVTNAPLTWMDYASIERVPDEQTWPPIVGQLVELKPDSRNGYSQGIPQHNTHFRFRVVHVRPDGDVYAIREDEPCDPGRVPERTNEYGYTGRAWYVNRDTLQPVEGSSIHTPTPQSEFAIGDWVKVTGTSSLNEDQKRLSWELVSRSGDTWRGRASDGTEVWVYDIWGLTKVDPPNLEPVIGRTVELSFILRGACSAEADYIQGHLRDHLSSAARGGHMPPGIDTQVVVTDAHRTTDGRSHAFFCNDCEQGFDHAEVRVTGTWERTQSGDLEVNATIGPDGSVEDVNHEDADDRSYGGETERQLDGYGLYCPECGGDVDYDDDEIEVSTIARDLVNDIDIDDYV